MASSTSGSLIGVAVGVVLAFGISGCGDDATSALTAPTTSPSASSAPDPTNDSMPRSSVPVDAMEPGDFRRIDDPGEGRPPEGRPFALADGSYVTIASETDPSSGLPQSRFHRFVDGRWEAGAVIPFRPADRGSSVGFSPSGGFFSLTGTSGDAGESEYVVTSSQDLVRFSTASLPTPDDPARPGEPLAHFSDLTLATGDAGVLVVGKVLSDSAYESSPIAWFSSDGAEFDPVDVSIFGPIPNGLFIAAFEEGFVALVVSSELAGPYRSYFSADGRTWAASDAAMGVFDDSRVHAVFTIGSRVVAHGTSQGEWVSWTTDDGVAWAKHQLGVSIPDLDSSDLFVTIKGFGPGGVFALVTDPNSTRPPPSEAMVVFSNDGETWGPVDLSAFGAPDTEVDLVAAVAGSGRTLLYVWENPGDPRETPPLGRWFLGDMSS